MPSIQHDGLPSDDLAGLGAALLGEVAERLAQIDGDISPERAAVRLKDLAAALSRLPPRDLLLTTAAVAVAGVNALDRRTRIALGESYPQDGLSAGPVP